MDGGRSLYFEKACILKGKIRQTGKPGRRVRGCFNPSPVQQALVTKLLSDRGCGDFPLFQARQAAPDFKFLATLYIRCDSDDPRSFHSGLVLLQVIRWLLLPPKTRLKNALKEHADG